MGFKQVGSSKNNERLVIPAVIFYKGQRRTDLAQIEFGISDEVIFHRFISTNIKNFNEQAETVNRNIKFVPSSNPKPTLTDGNEMIFKDKSFVVKEEKAFVEIYDPTWDCHIFLIKK